MNIELHPLRVTNMQRRALQWTAELGYLTGENPRWAHLPQCGSYRFREHTSNDDEVINMRIPPLNLQVTISQAAELAHAWGLHKLNDTRTREHIPGNHLRSLAWLKKHVEAIINEGC